LASVERILFLLGWVVLGAGIVLVLIGLGVALVGMEGIPHSRTIDNVISVPLGLDNEYLRLPLDIQIDFVLSMGENIKIDGTAREVDNRDFNFYLFTKTNYELWKMGKSYNAYFEGKNQWNYGFSISPSKEDFDKLLFLVQGENRAVRISATVRWIGAGLFTRFLGGLAGMMFLIYGFSCAGGGLILIFLFKKRKEKRLVQLPIWQVQQALTAAGQLQG